MLHPYPVFEPIHLKYARTIAAFEGLCSFLDRVPTCKSGPCELGLPRDMIMSVGDRDIIPTKAKR